MIEDRVMSAHVDQSEQRCSRPIASMFRLSRSLGSTTGVKPIMPEFGIGSGINRDRLDSWILFMDMG